ncbi:carbohydrate phosphatase [Setomelanomma holmii]|uniref:Carbohydrate phosphatase n=1 Tax=Setomelanomma holmii TaxID=210430 RepID=A0A9P4HHY9_9PLEO|nr:carbohydrate phosphatase [Setomelanomma holmii]
MGLPPESAQLRAALQAVHAASLLTKSVLRSLKNNVGAETKDDDSPVTIADFAAQALLISALHAVYPSDAFIGEESADALRQNEALADRVWSLVLRAKERAYARQDGNGVVQMPREGAGTLASADSFPTSKEEMFERIDRGGKGQVTGSGRVWVMDPVDGTATFMQGKQYAVALCLLVDGVQQVGVVGCPNLAFDVHGPLRQTRVHEDQVDGVGYGVVLSAAKGHGTYVRAMQEDGLGEPRLVDLTSRPTKSLTDLNLVETTVGKTSLCQDEHMLVAESLGSSWPGTVVWSQQMKYVALTLGATDVMVRIPKTKERFTYIWDHAGGHILYQEAGGMIKDFDGKPVDFSKGRQIKGEANHGMIAAMPGIFDAVDKAVQDVLARRGP